MHQNYKHYKQKNRLIQIHRIKYLVLHNKKWAKEFDKIMYLILFIQINLIINLIFYLLNKYITYNLNIKIFIISLKCFYKN
jgi:hypothetical protein